MLCLKTIPNQSGATSDVCSPEHILQPVHAESFLTLYEKPVYSIKHSGLHCEDQTLSSLMLQCTPFRHQSPYWIQA